MELKNRKVVRFRTQIDPMIGAKARNAFDLREFKPEETGTVFELTPAGVYVKLPEKDGSGKWAMVEHIVPFANIQSIKLAPPTPTEDKKKSEE